MELRWKNIAIALTVLPIAALIFAWIGFFNIGASSGHWKITEWFLHTAMRAAVKTYAFLEVEPPSQLPHRDVTVAAAHFGRGCAGCHGEPGRDTPPMVRRMLPPPPALSGKVDEWSDAELFWIVENGVRFTGMPAWPTQSRDDEVWAMVAFLRALPHMDEQTYQHLSRSGNGRLDIRPGNFEDALAECSRCHGRDGTKGGGILPVVAGQSEAYLLATLKAYADQHRSSGIMTTSVDTIDPALFGELARHFSMQEAVVARIPADRDDGSVAAGIVYRGDRQRAIPACFGCHGDFENRNGLYPKIAGQGEDYLAGQLRMFRGGLRGGGSSAHLMQKSAEHLSDDDINGLAAFLSGLERNIATPPTQPR